MKTDKVRDSIKSAMKLLAVRDYFSCELRGKLILKGASEHEADAAIEYVSKFGYVNDAETLKKYSCELAAKRKGFYYLKKKLYDKGCMEIVSSFDLRDFYTVKMEKEAITEWLEKVGNHDKKVLLKKLSSRGFASEAVYEVLGILKDNDME